MARTPDTVRLELLMSAADAEKLDAIRAARGDCSRVAALRQLVREEAKRQDRREKPKPPTSSTPD